MREDDWPYLYAAYRKGAFREFLEAFRESYGIEEELPDAPKPKEFRTFMSLAMQHIPLWWVLSAKRRDKLEPVGLMAGAHRDAYMEPHVEWFAWASDRNKIETIVKFVEEIRPILVWARESEISFWRRIGNYGSLKQVGPIPGLFDGEDGYLFRSV